MKVDGNRVPLLGAGDKDAELGFDAPKPPNVIPQDAGIGWAVVCASFTVHFVCLGLLYSFGVFFVEFHQRVFPQATAHEIAWIGSISIGVMNLWSLLSGAWADRYGHACVITLGAMFVSSSLLLSSFATEMWHLYLTHGFMLGAGISMCWIPAVTLVSRFFTARRALAVGLAAAGSGAGNGVVPPVAQILMDAYGWRDAFRYMSIAALVILLPMTLVLKLPKGAKSAKKDRSLMWSLFKDPAFVALFLAQCFYRFGYFIPFTYIPEFAESHGISKAGASLLLTAVGVTSTVGRPLFGQVADHPWFGARRMMIFAAVMKGGLTLLLPQFVETKSLLVYCGYYGLFTGAFIGLNSVCVAGLFGVERLSSVMGMVQFGSTAPNFLGPPAAGYLLEKTSFDWQVPYTMSGIAMATAGPLLWWAGVLQERANQQQRRLSSMSERDVSGDISESPSRDRDLTVSSLTGSMLPREASSARRMRAERSYTELVRDASSSGLRARDLANADGENERKRVFDRRTGLVRTSPSDADADVSGTEDTSPDAGTGLRGM